MNQEIIRAKIIAESAANVTETEPPKPPPDEDESKPPVKEPPTEEPPVKEPPKESLKRFAHAKTVGFAKTIQFNRGGMKAARSCGRALYKCSVRPRCRFYF